MRIGLFVGEFPHPAATSAIRRAIGLLGAGVDVRIVAVRPSHARVEHEDVQRHRLLERTVFRDGGHAREALAFDVIHVEGNAEEAMRLRAEGSLRGPMVVSVRRGEPAATVHVAESIVVRTRAAADSLRRSGCAAERIAVLPPLVAETPTRARRRPGRPRRLLSVGTLDDGRRLRAALHAHAERRWTDVVHDIVGDGSARHDLELLAARLDVAERVRFHGWCSWRRIAGLFEAADLFVLLGGDAVPLWEAQAAGLPVVATADAETSEAVRDGDTGLLVPSEDATTIAHAIEWMLDDEPNYRRMSALAQLHAREWNRGHLEALQRYRALISRRGT